jgi:hypothetical protein
MLPILKIAKIELRLNPITAANTNKNNFAVDELILSTRNINPKLIASGANITTHLNEVPQITPIRAGDIETPIETNPLTASATVI